MAIGRKPKFHCEAEACQNMANHVMRAQGMSNIHLCERHWKREKSDPGSVELVKKD